MGVYDAWAWFWLKATPGGMASTTFWPPKNDNYDPAKDVPDLSGKVSPLEIEVFAGWRLC